jgi:hypothetical protein
MLDKMGSGEEIHVRGGLWLNTPFPSAEKAGESWVILKLLMVIKVLLDASLEIIFGALVRDIESKGDLLEFRLFLGRERTRVLDRGHGG